MNISTIQKTRFLNNIYKILYSSGKQVNETLVKSAFNEYFSVNRPGFPLNVDYNLLRATNKTNVDLLNQIMVNTVFNVDILYESVLENNEKLFSTITSLNKKLESLKAKRIELESKVDDLLFVNNNSDGYFYAYTENFSTANKLDLNLSDSILYDPSLKNITISKLNSNQFNVASMDELSSISPTFAININGVNSSQIVDETNFINIFDGLNDTYWSHTVFLDEPKSVSLSMIVPVAMFQTVSRIDGVIFTSSPTNIIIKATVNDPNKESQIKSQNSKGDYDSFSFAVSPERYSSIEIVLQKTEPDYINEFSNSPYAYKFGLRELSINSRYHAQNGVLISAPISIPTAQNSNLTIDAVGIEVVEQVNKNTSIKYYIAPDNPDAESISDFSWIPISPSGSESEGYSSIVYLDGSSRLNKYIKNNPDQNDLKYISLSSNSKNANEINPTPNIYSGKEIYRIVALDSSINYLNPVFFSNINSFKHHYLVTQSEDVGVDQDEILQSVQYNDLGFWNNILRNKPANLFETTLKEQTGTMAPGLNPPVSGYIESYILRDAAASISHTTIKSSPDFNLGIYLNGILIGDLPRGTLTKSIQFNFIQGINKITVTYDKNYSGVISFSLMEGLSLSRYGTIFTDSFQYLDPLEFQNRSTSDGYYFTIDTVFGRKEILTTKLVSGDSNFIFTVNDPLNVPAIRYRVDMNRYDNPYSSPILQTIKIKFKHRDA